MSQMNEIAHPMHDAKHPSASGVLFRSSGELQSASFLVLCSTSTETVLNFMIDEMVLMGNYFQSEAVIRTSSDSLKSQFYAAKIVYIRFSHIENKLNDCNVEDKIFFKYL